MSPTFYFYINILRKGIDELMPASHKEPEPNDRTNVVQDYQLSFPYHGYQRRGGKIEQHSHTMDTRGEGGK